MPKRTLALALTLGAFAAACGGGSGTTTPTGPSPTPGPTPITVALRLGVAQPSTATDVTIGPPRQGLHTALSIDIEATGGSATVVVACEPHGFDLPPAASIDIHPPGAVMPGSPFSTVVDVPLFVDFPPPAALGGFTCTATGTDERGGAVSVSTSVDLPQTATRPRDTTCTADDETICALAGGRFEVKVDWRTADGQSGAGHVQPGGRYDDGGYMYFFDQQNWNVLVQVVNQCPSNGHYWVFAAGQTDVAVDIQVTDTSTGVRRVYQNPLGSRFAPVQDTSAFATCP
ncbi:MAG: hypothetical protein AB7O67_02680 [Vicinamibacterales bacterium]